MITLTGNNSAVLSVSLYDVLSQISDIEKYKWKILLIEGVSFSINMEKLDQKIRNSPDGFSITGKELLKMSKLFFQLIEIILIGDKYPENLNRTLNDEGYINVELLQNRCEFYIELIDGGFWEIETKNQKFKDNILQKLI